MKIQKNNSSKGFSLIEVVVVMALLIILIDAVVIIFISIIKHQRNILNEQEYLNQASYAQEYISRALRSALPNISDSCPDFTVNGIQVDTYKLTDYNEDTGYYGGIKFVSDSGCQHFFFDGSGSLKESRPVSVGTEQPPQDILSNNLKVKDVKFIMNGDKDLQGDIPGSLIQTRITFAITVDVQHEGGLKERKIQTTISLRNISSP